MALARIYLLAYNGASFVLWAALLGYTLGLGGGGPGPTTVVDRVAAPPPLLLTATQTLALVEIAHAAAGLVRAAPAATALQVGGKNLVVWTVMVPFWDQLVFSPAAAAAVGGGPAVGSASSAVSRAGLAGFLGCVLAWSTSEMVRFGYFAVQLARGREPFGWLKWLRYNAFLVLYPIGLLSEALLVYLALTQVTGIGTLYRAYLFLGLLTYLPAGPYLYMHMLAQRRKMLKRAAKAQ